MGNCSPYATTVKIGWNRQEEFRNEIIEKNTKKNYFLVSFSRFLSSRPIGGLHFVKSCWFDVQRLFTFRAFALPGPYEEHYLNLRSATYSLTVQTMKTRVVR